MERNDHEKTREREVAAGDPLGLGVTPEMNGLAERGSSARIAGGNDRDATASNAVRGWLVHIALSLVRVVLVTVGMVALVPQGLIPLGMNLVGANDSLRLWLLARYLPPEWQVLAALGFVVSGALTIWIGLLQHRWLGTRLVGGGMVQ
ncbi:hypothetical protein ACWGSK_11830 [Nocardiopsis sp. NPDC055551]|uniref:hypothetical protein n=1 Tax=Nocardiopsis sp. NPDC006832 TaxID=3157188 RepID=UPI0033E77E0D